MLVATKKRQKPAGSQQSTKALQRFTDKNLDRVTRSGYGRAS
jgi:hypothetical protein